MTIGADENLPTLWQHFMIRHGELPDRHPVELFGEAVVNRIFAGAEDCTGAGWPGQLSLD